MEMWTFDVFAALARKSHEAEEEEVTMSHEDTLRRIEEARQVLKNAEHEESMLLDSIDFLSLQMRVRQTQALEKIAIRLAKIDAHLGRMAGHM